MAEARGQQQQSEQTEKKQEQQSASMNKASQAEEREPGRGIEPYRASAELMRPDWTSSPFSMMGRLMGDMNRLFEDFGFGQAFGSPLMPRGETAFARAPWIPRVDIFERDGNLVVHADLPGLRQEDVNVKIDNGVLTVSGERSHTHEHESGGVYRCERSYGRFQRSLALPEGVDPESVQASFDNGVLEVTMPMPQQQAPKGRAVPIRSSSGSPETKH